MACSLTALIVSSKEHFNAISRICIRHLPWDVDEKGGWTALYTNTANTHTWRQHLYMLSLTPGSLEGAGLRAGCHGDPFFALCSPCALCPDDCPPQLKGSRHTHTHASQMLSCIHIHTHTHGVLPGKPTKLQLLSCWFNLSLQSKRVDSTFKLLCVNKLFLAYFLDLCLFINRTL